MPSLMSGTWNRIYAQDEQGARQLKAEEAY